MAAQFGFLDGYRSRYLRGLRRDYFEEVGKAVSAEDIDFVSLTEDSGETLVSIRTYAGVDYPEKVTTPSSPECYGCDTDITYYRISSTRSVEDALKVEMEGWNSDPGDDILRVEMTEGWDGDPRDDGLVSSGSAMPR